MLIKIYSVYDSKAEAYMQPFYFQSRGQAVRAFIDTAQDATTTIGKHPQDYTLFELGVYDDSSAVFDMHATPVSLGVALELVSRDS